MSESIRCPECGSELPTGATEGLCPKCLMSAALESDSSGEAQPGSPFAATTPMTGGFVPPEVASLAAHFPQLEILELVGHGGMGAVYKARQVKLDRLVALKIIRPESADDPTFAERFNREARTLARLNHPHIVAVHDFGEVPMSSGGRQSASGGRQSPGARPTALYYFLMEYVDGVNLRQMIASRELTPQQALAIVPQVCEALQYAHDEGIVHRDIKPENVLVDTKGRVKIADFGLAKLTASGGRESPDFTLTATHQVMGTPRYMAPEQMTGSHHVDHRADIYSLGVVFYEMLTGEVPMGAFDPPSKKAEIDARLDQVVLRAMANEPDRRYQQASEIRTDVESIAFEAARLSGAGASQPFSSIAPAAQAPLPGPSTILERGVAAMVARLRGVGEERHSDSPARDTAAVAHRLVRGPGIALMILGLVLLLPAALLMTNGIDIADGNDATPAYIGLGAIVASLCLVGICGLLLRGGWHMLTLEKYSAALLASFLGQPIGLWGLFVLGRPEVKSAFAVGPRRAASTPSDATPRFSRKAILGAIWAGMFFFTLGTVVPATLTLQMDQEAESVRRHARSEELRQIGRELESAAGVDSQPGESLHDEHSEGHSGSASEAAQMPQVEEAHFTMWILLLLGLVAIPSALAPFGTTILGMVAISDIRNSKGQLTGLGLAVTDAVLFPLLALGAALFAVNYYLWWALLAPSREEFVVPASIASSAIVWGLLAFVFIRWAWRAASAAKDGLPTESGALLRAGEGLPAGAEAHHVGGRDWVTLSRDEVENDRIPDVCMVCGRPARERVNKTFDYQPDWAGILTVVGMVLAVFPGLIIAHLTSTQVRVACPVCPRHRNHWRRLVWVASLGWLLMLVLGAVGCGVAWVIYGTGVPQAVGAAIGAVVGLIVYLVPVIYLASTRVGVELITKDEIRFHRVAAAFANAVAGKQHG